MNKDLLKGLSDAQITKLKGCKNQDEILKLAKEEGIELTDEQLGVVTGGGILCGDCIGDECPMCHGVNTQTIYCQGEVAYHYCNDCEKHFFDK